MPTRLDKLISDSGLYSRSEARLLIRAGRVTAGGVVMLKPDAKVDAKLSPVALDGQQLRCDRLRYFMLNKPAGVLSATEDRKARTVLDLLPRELSGLGLFPVGRLDKDTTGLLLLTNDGDFAHRVISPKSAVMKLYRAETESPVDASDALAFAEGVVLRDGTVCLPARLEGCEDGSCEVSVMEGKYHQVKRMLASRGRPVKALHRLKIGALCLDESLEEGKCRELTNLEKMLVFEKLQQNENT